MQYSIRKHIHNYAVWSAARAVQRNFTTTAKIKTAIEKTTLRLFAEHPDVTTIEEFDEIHHSLADQLITAFEKLSVPCSYGRASKIIAVYLKTSVIIPNKGKSFACQLIHPPIDAILLRNIYADKKIKQMKNLRWTTFDDHKYKEVVSLLRKEFGECNWKLEKYWSPEQDDSTAQISTQQPTR